MKYYLIILSSLILVGCSSTFDPISAALPSSPNGRVAKDPKPLEEPLKEDDFDDDQEEDDFEESSLVDDSQPEKPTEPTVSATEIDEAKKELAKQQKIYTEQIKPNLNNDYSGFNTRFNIFNGEKSALSRLNSNDVLFFAELSDLVYVNKFKTINEIETGLFERLGNERYKGYELIGTIRRAKGTELSAVMLYSQEKNHLIVVFRGSVTKADWAKNLQFTKYIIKEKDLKSSNPRVASFAKEREKALSTLGNNDLSVHGGFAKIYLGGLQQFNKQFQAILQKYSKHIKNNSKPFRVTTTGHSLGGALALIQANDFPRILLESGLFVDDNKFIVEVVSFGAPRVYDDESSREVERNLRGAHNIIRFAHEADPVPNLPTKRLGGASDIGVTIYLSSVAGGIIKNPARHMMGGYLKLSPPAFKKLQKEFFLSKETKEKIISLKRIIGDTSPNSFDKIDTAQKVQHALDEYQSKQSFLKKMLDSSLGDENTQATYEQIAKVVTNLRHLQASLNEDIVDI